MTGRIIPLHDDPHQAAQSLLPWYVTGRLDRAEQAKVEAHLGVCAECQAELKGERWLDAQIAGLPLDVEQGWARLRPRLEPTATWRGRLAGWRARLAGGRAAGTWLGWTVAVQACLLLALGALWLAGGVSRPAAYRVLGAAPAARAGDVVVMFRPETRERDLRAILQASHARLVDGPTAADAYVLSVAPTERPAALALLRRRAEVELAEPVDSGRSP